MSNHWDKQATKELVNKGLTWEQARIAIGVIAEHRQLADLEGYKRGYNSDYFDARRSLPSVGN